MIFSPLSFTKSEAKHLTAWHSQVSGGDRRSVGEPDAESAGQRLWGESSMPKLPH